MRMIDADEMLENLTEAYINAQPNCDELTAKVNMIVHEKITRLINDTPTAYDVKAVEKQIHKYFKGEIDTLNGKAPWDILKHNKAVCEIVKRGGIDET